MGDNRLKPSAIAVSPVNGAKNNRGKGVGRPRPGLEGRAYSGLAAGQKPRERGSTAQVRAACRQADRNEPSRFTPNSEMWVKVRPDGRGYNYARPSGPDDHTSG